MPKYIDSGKPTLIHRNQDINYDKNEIYNQTNFDKNYDYYHIMGKSGKYNFKKVMRNPIPSEEKSFWNIILRSSFSMGQILSPFGLPWDVLQ